MKKYIPPSKAGFIIRLESDTNMYLKQNLGFFKKGSYDFKPDKFGAATFTRDKAQRLIKHLRENGNPCTLKPIGKNKLRAAK